MSEIALWIDNLMDRVRVSDHLQKNGFQIDSIPDSEICYEFLQAKSGIVVIDLQNASLDFKKMRRQFAAQRKLTDQIVSYFPHVQIHLKKEAEQCGIRHIYPRSAFFGDILTIIQRVIKENESKGWHLQSPKRDLID